jgi:hypothetical protein
MCYQCTLVCHQLVAHSLKRSLTNLCSGHTSHCTICSLRQVMEQLYSSKKYFVPTAILGSLNCGQFLPPSLHASYLFSSSYCQAFPKESSRGRSRVLAISHRSLAEVLRFSPTNTRRPQARRDDMGPSHIWGAVTLPCQVSGVRTSKRHF